MEEEWTYSQKFDFIHGRALCTCFGDPAAVISKAFDSLAPNGYLEMQDATLALRCVDESLNDTALERWVSLLFTGAKKLGRDWSCATKYKQYMRDAGFVDVQERQYKWPINTWPKAKQYKTLGSWVLQNFLNGVHAASMAVLSRGLGMSREEVEMLLVDVRNDLGNRGIHAYMPM